LERESLDSLPKHPGPREKILGKNSQMCRNVPIFNFAQVCS
jgi:hypothetical protein